MRWKAADAIFLAFLAWLPAGCSSGPVWTHPTKDSYESKTDAADCERFFSGSEKDQENCMKQRGWQRGK
jgi:hypothetical protein